MSAGRKSGRLVAISSWFSTRLLSAAMDILWPVPPKAQMQGLTLLIKKVPHLTEIYF
ncbi:hypothetical protein [Mycobacterium lepromatosis]|uniref:hypothetical protein n=1 Tax=Mycobacterium lepromatosis TaxID=480418 RepID=UPI00158467A6|nr:hypothetical protein [Mycobacterium lepromatosis]